MARVKQRTEGLRAEILSAALVVLEAEGINGFTTRTLANSANTSAPAVYELFGDKAGVIRALFFEGFRRLSATLDRVDLTDDPRDVLRAAAQAFGVFAAETPALASVMFSRPFAEFAPTDTDNDAGDGVRRFLVRAVHRAYPAMTKGEVTDAAHVFLAAMQGLMMQEHAGLLGASPASISRRWRLGVDALIAGFSQLSPPDSKGVALVT